MRSLTTVPYFFRGAIVALVFIVAAGLLFGSAGLRPEPRSAEATNLNEIRKLLASDAQASDNFGFSVAVSGDTAVVGAFREDARGSSAGAAYVFDLTQTKPTPPQPAVLLVHGWRGSCDAMQALSDFLTSKGYLPSCFGDPGYDHERGTIKLAEVLKTHIEDEMGLGAGEKIHILAHSFGGLVARWYIEKDGGNARVETLTMLGTPNLGTRAASAASGWDHLQCFFGVNLCIEELLDLKFVDDYAAKDMIPRKIGSDCPTDDDVLILRRLNNCFQFPSGTTYKAIAGNVSNAGSCPFDPVPCLAYRFFGETNDCLVPLDSVKGPFAAVTVQPVSHPAACIIGSNLRNDNSTDGCVSDTNHVFWDVLAALLGGGGAGSGMPTAVAGTGGGGQALSTSIADMVLPSATNTHIASVDSSATSAVFALWWEDEVGTTDFGFILETPSGTPVTASGGNVTYNAPLEFFDDFWVEWYEVTSPEAGDWDIFVEGVSVPADGAVYIVDVPLDSPVTMETETSDVSLASGESLTITAALGDSGTPITGATVTVDITKPDGSTAVVALLDDGVGADPAAADGEYNGTFADTSACGIYWLQWSATGTASGGAFSRGDTAFVTSCFDNDSDGCTDVQEFGDDETLGGQRDPGNPHDFYDVLGPGAALPTDGVIDLPNDILGVIQRYSPTGAPPYDVQFNHSCQ